jgi:hypothetical protein
MAGRLARRLLGRRLSRRQRQLAGMLMRWPYGVAWGTATAALAPDGVPPPVVGLAAGVAIWAFELVALPASGATPPVRAWRAGEIGVNLLNATAFGLAAAEVLSRTSAGRSSRRPR